jgi:HlyD family secretion protein
MNTKNKKSIGALLAGATAILMLSACSAAPNAASASNANSAKRVAVEVTTIESRVISTGKIAPRTTTAVAFTRSGSVKEVLVKEGDTVKTGQVIARLETTDLELTAQQQKSSYESAKSAYEDALDGPSQADLKSATASLYSAQAAYADLSAAPKESALNSARATLLDAEATLKQKQTAYDRAFRMNPAGIGASTESIDLEKATNSYNSALANYNAKFEKSSAAQYASASANIASAQAKLDSLSPTTATLTQSKAKLDQAFAAWQQAENNVKSATLTAPASGLVSAVNVDPGEWANTGASAIEIMDAVTPIMEVDVDETDLGGIKVGQTARVQLQTYAGQPFGAKVDSMANVGKTVNNVVTYKVKLTLIPDAERAIRLGMSGTSEIIVSSIANAIMVPNEALVADTLKSNYTVLKVAADGGTSSVPVTLGVKGNEKTQVFGDLKAGDQLSIPAAKAQGLPGPGNLPAP